MLPYGISNDQNPEDIQKAAPDHSVDAVRYVLTAANQGHQSYRQSQRNGPHPLMWGKEEKPRGYSGGVRTFSSQCQFVEGIKRRATQTGEAGGWKTT
jgi:hypothetical protein